MDIQKIRVHPGEQSQVCVDNKYEYIPGNVRNSNLKCGNYQAPMKELYTNFQRRSMKQE